MSRITVPFSTGLCLGVACFVVSAADAADSSSAWKDNWHHWRGPSANGVAAQGNPAIEWSEQKNIKWKVEIPGKGSATPIVWGDRVFVLTAVATGNAAAQPPAEQDRSAGRKGKGARGSPPSTPHRFLVICFDRKSGKQLWQQVAAELVPHEGLQPTNTYASGSPTTDGEFLYVSFGSRGIYCYDLDGNLQWKKDLGDMQTRNGFGEGTSPTIHKDTLVINWDHEGPSFLAALDARTGATRWQVDRKERTTWATPLVLEHGRKTQVVTNGSTRVRSYDLATGELIWECGGQAANPIPSPVVQGDLVYCMTGYQGFAVYAIPLDATGDISNSTKIAWKRTDSGPYVSSPVLYGGQLYFTKERNAILSSLDARTGEPRINQVRMPGLDAWVYASPVAASDRIYFTDRDGTTLVLKHGPTLEVLATNKLDDGIDASPAIVGRQMFLRGQRHLYCIEEQGAE